MKTDEEIERNYEKSLERMRTSDVLGKWYKPKRRHRVLPKIELKPLMNNVMSSLSVVNSVRLDTQMLPLILCLYSVNKKTVCAIEYW